MRLSVVNLICASSCRSAALCFANEFSEASQNTIPATTAIILSGTKVESVIMFFVVPPLFKITSHRATMFLSRGSLPILPKIGGLLRMAKIKIETEVSKEAYELSQGLVRLVGAVRKSLADGWQTGEDLPAIVAAAMSEVGRMVEGITLLDDEFAEDPAAFTKAFGVSIADFIKVLKES